MPAEWPITGKTQNNETAIATATDTLVVLLSLQEMNSQEIYKTWERPSRSRCLSPPRFAGRIKLLTLLSPADNSRPYRDRDKGEKWPDASWGSSGCSCLHWDFPKTNSDQHINALLYDIFSALQVSVFRTSITVPAGFHPELLKANNWLSDLGIWFSIMPPGNVFPPLLRAPLRASAMSTQIAVAAAVAGIGVYAWYRRSNGASSDKPVFSSFGFHTLRLQSTELINHNTKRLRFELPDATQPSGLSLTSALLTISFPSGRWLPVIRPYTPVNDLSMLHPPARPVQYPDIACYLTE